MGVSYSTAKWLVNISISPFPPRKPRLVMKLTHLPGSSQFRHRLCRPTIRPAQLPQHARCFQPASDNNHEPLPPLTIPRHPRREPLLLQPATLLHRRLLLPATAHPTSLAVSALQARPEKAGRAQRAGPDRRFRPLLHRRKPLHCQ